jgi:hypothetical protein
MTVDEIRQNLLDGLRTVAESHGALLRDGRQHYTPVLYESQLSCSQAKVTTAKTMCRLAGIDEDAVRAVVEIGVGSHQSAER